MNTLKRAVAMTKEFYKSLGHIAPAAEFNDISIFLEEATPERNDCYLWTDIGGGRLFADCFESMVRYDPERRVGIAIKTACGLPTAVRFVQWSFARH